MYEIKTSDYIKTKKVLVDGNEWTMHPPGAGDELALNQAKRRVELLEKKIKADTATDADYDLYDQLENRMYKVWSRVFRDTSEDNASVKKWLDETPLAVVMQVVEDISSQIKEKENVDGGTQVS